MADPMTKTDALKWMLRQLGCGVVNVEVTDEHADDAFDDAVRWYVARRAIKRHAVAQIVTGIQEYAMPDDTDEVIWVAFPGMQLDVLAAVNPYAFVDVDQLPVAYQWITGVPGQQFYSTLHQMIQHAATARRVVGSEPAWDYHKDENKLYVFPKQQMNGVAIVRYASTTLNVDDPVAPATTPVNDFRRLRTRERELILRYAKARLKEVLGRVRGKYTEWPSAGGSKSMDGDTLLVESQAEVEALNQELMGLSDAVPFIRG